MEFAITWIYVKRSKKSNNNNSTNELILFTTDGYLIGNEYI